MDMWGLCGPFFERYNRDGGDTARAEIGLITIGYHSGGGEPVTGYGLTVTASEQTFVFAYNGLKESD